VNKRPELLSPAGTLQHLTTAFAFGADAVYAGMPRYGLRVRENSFDIAGLAEGIDIAHKLDKRLFVTANIIAHNSKVHTFADDIAEVISLKPDALIMADPGLIHLVRERWPEQEIHISVQANSVNYATVNFWKSIGAKRVILSRELSLDEVAEIRQLCPDIEIEVFIHGALCMAYSGRCLLSGYINHRDANQGSCTNACRWEYKEVASEEDDNGDLKIVLDEADSEPVELKPLPPQRILIEEMGRPGEPIPLEEDEHGTYIMNSKDLRAVEHVQRLVDIGVDSLKIEGRTKSIYYVSRVTQSYRRAIDDAVAGRSFDTTLLAELENMASRGYTDGFFKRHHSEEYQNYIQGNSEGHRQIYVAEVTDYDPKQNEVTLLAKNKFSVGDRVELISPQGNRELTLEHIRNRRGDSVEVVPGGGHEAKITLELTVEERANYQHIMLARFL
jgi:putative protease